MSAPTSELDGANVFINCPFSSDYEPLFDAVVFSVIDCGARPRSALEAIDGGEVRLEKIVQLIRQSKLAIHDISIMELDAGTKLARLNMAFELGMWVGAASFGRGRKSATRCLILDREAYRYRQALSDISGQDIHAHGGDPQRAIAAVRSFLNQFSGTRPLPGPAHIWKRFNKYLGDRPSILSAMNVTRAELDFVDKTKVISEWLRSNG